jgi:hypothetical protein
MIVSPYIITGVDLSIQPRNIIKPLRDLALSGKHLTAFYMRC